MTKSLPMPAVGLIVLSVFVALMALTGVSVFAHGGGANGVDSDSPSCMGQLARLHANGQDPGANPDTMNGFGTNQGHPGLGGPYDTIQDQAKAFQAYCGIGQAN